jgi:diadenosine tetraphosphate (Ap4A) HIT family hydrolase
MADPDGFELDPRLAADTRRVGDLPLSRVLLMDDARFPWLLLVPRRAGRVELDDLPRAERITLLDEIDLATRALRALVAPDKLNVATLGNVVAQLHVHVIARFRADAAWPRPVWGVGERVPYAPVEATKRIARLRDHLGLS